MLGLQPGQRRNVINRRKDTREHTQAEGREQRTKETKQGKKKTEGGKQPAKSKASANAKTTSPSTS